MAATEQPPGQGLAVCSDAAVQSSVRGNVCNNTRKRKVTFLDFEIARERIKKVPICMFSRDHSNNVSCSTTSSMTLLRLRSRCRRRTRNPIIIVNVTCSALGLHVRKISKPRPRPCEGCNACECGKVRASV